MRPALTSTETVLLQEGKDKAQDLAIGIARLSYLLRRIPGPEGSGTATDTLNPFIRDAAKAVDSLREALNLLYTTGSN
jgi:hypothetical protein